MVKSKNYYGTINIKHLHRVGNIRGRDPGKLFSNQVKQEIMIDLKKYCLILLFKLNPLGRELGYNSQAFRLTSPHHVELYKALHFAIKKVIEDFGGLEYRKNNAKQFAKKRGPKPRKRYLD